MSWTCPISCTVPSNFIGQNIGWFQLRTAVSFLASWKQNARLDVACFCQLLIIINQIASSTSILLSSIWPTLTMPKLQSQCNSKEMEDKGNEGTDDDNSLSSLVMFWYWLAYCCILYILNIFLFVLQHFVHDINDQEPVPKAIVVGDGNDNNTADNETGTSAVASVPSTTAPTPRCCSSLLVMCAPRFLTFAVIIMVGSWK